MARPIVHFSIMFISMAIASFIVFYTKNTNILNKFFFKEHFKLSLSQDDQKLIIIRHIFAYLSLFIFVPTFLTMLGRMLGKKPSPATEEDSLVIKVLNRIIYNSVQQTIVFLGLYSYFLFDKAGDRFKSREIILIASWFILARIIYAITYFIGGITGFPTLRTIGFSLTMTVQILLIELCFSPIVIGSKFLLGK